MQLGMVLENWNAAGDYNLLVL